LRYIPDKLLSSIIIGISNSNFFYNYLILLTFYLVD